MTSPVAGIDPHQDTFTVGIVDNHGVEICHETFDNTASGYTNAIDLLTTHRVQQVGVEGSAKWGAHAAIALSQQGSTHAMCRRLAPQPSADPAGST